MKAEGLRAEAVERDRRVRETKAAVSLSRAAVEGIRASLSVQIAYSCERDVALCHQERSLFAFERAARRSSVSFGSREASSIAQEDALCECRAAVSSLGDALCAQAGTLMVEKADACVPARGANNDSVALVDLTASMIDQSDALDSQSDALDIQGDALSDQTRKAVRRVPTSRKHCAGSNRKTECSPAVSGRPRSNRRCGDAGWPPCSDRAPRMSPSRACPRRTWPRGAGRCARSPACRTGPPATERRRR